MTGAPGRLSMIDLLRWLFHPLGLFLVFALILFTGMLLEHFRKQAKAAQKPTTEPLSALVNAALWLGMGLIL